MVDEVFMRAARSAGLTVNVWSGFDETGEDVERLVGLCADGLITTRPERARAVVEDAFLKRDPMLRITRGLHRPVLSRLDRWPASPRTLLRATGSVRRWPRWSRCVGGWTSKSWGSPTCTSTC